MGDWADYYVDGHGIDKNMGDRIAFSPRDNFHSLPTKLVKAAKEHRCTWCNCLIKKGDMHHYWRSVGDSFTENRMHNECLAAAVQGAFKYKPKRNKRGVPADATAGSKHANQA